MMGISVWKLWIILAIVIVLFGTGRLSGFCSDMGKAVRGFRNLIGEKESQ